MTPGRRSLQFDSIDEIIPEVERLRKGCKTVGAWSLAHICGHLASVIKGTLERPRRVLDRRALDAVQSGEAGRDPRVGDAARRVAVA